MKLSLKYMQKYNLSSNETKRKTIDAKCFPVPLYIVWREKGMVIREQVECRDPSKIEYKTKENFKIIGAKIL